MSVLQNWDVLSSSSVPGHRGLVRIVCEGGRSLRSMGDGGVWKGGGVAGDA